MIHLQGCINMYFLQECVSLVIISIDCKEFPNKDFILYLHKFMSELFHHISQHMNNVFERFFFFFQVKFHIFI